MGYGMDSVSRYDGAWREWTRGAFVPALAVAAMVGAAAVSPARAVIGKTGDCPTLQRVAHAMPPNWNGDNTAQVALVPAQSINCIENPAGFKTELWASEENGGIKAVQAMNFDERGRAWVVETYDYPNDVKEPFSGTDRILILEDTDGDHVADKTTVFVSGLNMPTSLEMAPNGIIVTMPPYIVLFEDKNGDDKADDPKGKILYQGFNKANPGDTHGGINSVHYGLDNWYYAISGYNGGRVNGTTFSQGVFRFKGDGTKFEFLSATSNNSAGIGQLEDGQIVASTANGNHANHVVVPGMAAKNTSSYGEKFNPITKDVHQWDWVGSFTAASNHEVYTSRLFPKEYWNKATLTCEGTGHLINQDFLTPNGSTFTESRVAAAPNLLASKDAWTAPVGARTGPDGAVWVVDWYNYLFLHNPAQPAGDGGAVINDIRDKTRKRIYRILPTDGTLEPVLNLKDATPAQLVAAFGNPNFFWRLQAQRLLIQKGPDAATEALLSAAMNSRAKDVTGNDPVALHALWTLQGLGYFTSNAAKWDPILKDMLLHPAAAVRRNVLIAMPRTAASAAAIKDQGRVNDPDAQVRLQALLALGQMPATAGISMFADYHNLDDYSKEGFKRAGAGAGISESATLPTIPGLTPTGVNRPIVSEQVPRKGLAFHRLTDGKMELLPAWGLVSGRIQVYDMQGHLLVTSAWNGSAWSRSALAIPGSMFTYRFEGADGYRDAGRMVSAL